MHASPPRSLRQLPNALSAARIGSAPVLGYLAVAGAEQPFMWLLGAALLSDVADGFIARRLGLASRLGALLDSLGDALVFFATALGVAAFHPQLLHDHAAAVLLLVGCWVIEIGVALARYGRLSSFHTYLSKTAGYVLGVMIGVLFLWGLPQALLYAAVTVSVLSNFEELALICLLPDWRPDVKGLYWVLRERQSLQP